MVAHVEGLCQVLYGVVLYSGSNDRLSLPVECPRSRGNIGEALMPLEVELTMFGVEG